MANRIAERNLFKRAVWAEWDAVPDAVVAANHEEVREFERDIAVTAGVEPEHVLLDTPGEPNIPESSSRVVVNGEIRRLADQSPLVQGLQASQRTQWRLGVYAPEEATDAVAKAATSVLGLKLTKIETKYRFSSRLVAFMPVLCVRVRKPRPQK